MAVTQAVALARAYDGSWVPGDGIPWVCPECWFTLAPSSVAWADARRAMENHLEGGHVRVNENPESEEFDDVDSDLTDFNDDESAEAAVRCDSDDVPVHSDIRATSLEAPAPDPVKCPHCLNRMPETSLEKHIRRKHPNKAVALPPENKQGPTGATITAQMPLRTPAPAVQTPTPAPVLKSAAPPKLPVVQLPFKLLPPGSWQIGDVMDYYRAQTRGKHRLFGGRTIEPERLEALMSLQPTKCYTGERRWRGYVIFEFAGNNRVVLECPIAPNATYVLSGDWERMVRETKATLLREYRMYVTRIIHKSNWLENIRYALLSRR